MAVPLVIMSSGALKQWLSMTAFLLVACALLASEPAASVPSGKLADRIGEGSVVLRRRADTGMAGLFRRRATPAGPQRTGEAVSEPAARDTRHRGVSWVAGGEVSASDFEPLAGANVNWIVQTPFGWQRGHDATELKLVTDGRIFWGERDDGLGETARLARGKGIRTLLKPHIWLSGAKGKWRSDIEMGSEEDWAEWFASYRTFILHYARLAEEIGADALCVGTELRATVQHRPDAWRRLIAEVRQVYSGKLTYAANWYREFEEVPFWDALDYIGIQGYFPLAASTGATVESLVAGWRPHLDAIRAVQGKFDKPVLFTEIGYRAIPEAAIKPWEWPERGSAKAIPGGEQAQARAYRAFFETFWEQEWFAGAYFWKWFPGAGGRHDGPVGYTPQGRTAERVMAEWYGRRPRARVGG